MFLKPRFGQKVSKIAVTYRRIPIISPRFIFLFKGFLAGLILGDRELIFGGAYY